MSKIVVVGDYNIDLVLYLDRFPQVGETLNGKSFFEGPGGKGANQAVAASRLGADVTFFGAVGQDYYGRIALETWKENGVDVSKVIEDRQAVTAVAMIYVNGAGDNMIGVSQGANLLLTPEHVEDIRETIAEADVLMCTLGVPLEAVQRALQIARENDTIALLNPAPAVNLSHEVIELADYLTPNESELRTIIGGGMESPPAEIARQLMQRDDQVFIMTVGERGAEWITRTETGHVPAFDVKVEDTIGAGDAFNAALAVALAEGRELRDAIRFACATGSLSTTKTGAVAGMPMREDVDELLAKDDNEA